MGKMVSAGWVEVGAASERVSEWEGGKGGRA